MNKVLIRKAALSDVESIALLEKVVWGDSGADNENIESRIRFFSDGNLIATHGDNVVGYVSFQYVDDIINGIKFTWSEITDNGKIKQSHRPCGEFSYGINLSVHPSMNGLKVSDSLIMHGLADMIKNNKRGGFIGSRIPGFAKYKKQHPEITVEDYINLRRNNRRLRDPELALYEEDGFKAVKILPGYFPDPASLDYGVLVFNKNPFYNWPFRSILAWLIVKIGPKLIKSKKD